MPPLLGRALAESDESPSGDRVVVIGHDVWTSRFDSDDSVLGSTVRLGNVPHTVVGVMPEGFAFPVNHRFWTPLRRRSPESAEDEGDLFVFARLAPGTTLEGAQAELTTVGLLPLGVTESTATGSSSDDRREARVVPYIWAELFDATPAEARWVFRLSLLLACLLLIPPCATQVAIGGAVGGLLALATASLFPVEEIGGGHVPGVLPGTALLMLGIGLLAALGPSRRGLRVQPTEALRDG